VFRTAWLIVLLAGLVLMGCGGGNSGTAGSQSAPRPAARVSLPDTPPASADCPSNVIAREDVPHPSLGTVRLFLVLKSTSGPTQGCVIAAADTDKLVSAIPIDVSADSLSFANPVSDSTGNAFVKYNPGRYEGVLVLVPTQAGFEDIGWRVQHYSGKRAYYDAELSGPGPNGQYVIRASNNNCEPNCAGGTITTVDLHWDGHDYVP
jgi:hypothetical protein